MTMCVLEESEAYTQVKKEIYPCENTVTTWTQTRRMDGALQTP